MKNTLLLFFLIIAQLVNAQQTSGEIIYKHTTYWSKIYSNLPYLSQEERDREMQTWKNFDGYTVKMKLLFDANQSLYTYNSLDEEETTYSWRKDDYIIYRNFSENRLVEIQEMLGKTFLVKDELNPPKWKVLNELKEIQGHLCMKATSADTIKQYKIIAWFASDIPMPIGPEQLYGLPGAILEVDLNNGNVVIEAESITFKDVAADLHLPKKLKGKEVNLTELNQQIVEHIATSIKSHRNPYWAMRY